MSGKKTHLHTLKSKIEGKKTKLSCVGPCQTQTQFFFSLIRSCGTILNYSFIAIFAFVNYYMPASVTVAATGAGAVVFKVHLESAFFTKGKKHIDMLLSTKN